MTPSARNRQSVIRLHARFLFGLSILSMLFSALSSDAHAQLLQNQNEGQAEFALPETEEAIREEITRLQESLGDARQNYRRATAAMESTAPEILGATEDEIGRKARLLHFRVKTFEEQLEAYRTLEENRIASRDLSAEIEGWTGFSDPPPYLISMVDELRDAIHARELEIEKEEVRRSITQGALEQARERLEKGEQSLRKVQEDLEASTGPDDQVSLRWRYELSLLEQKVARAQMLTAETQRQVLEEVLAYDHQDLTFLERKLQVAAANAPFTEEELKQRLDEIAADREAVEKELRKAIRSDMRAQKSLDEAREALRQASEKSAEETDHLQRVTNARKAWADTTGQIVEGLQLFIRWLEAEKLGWEGRYRTAAAGETEIQAALESIDESRRGALDRQFDFDSRLKVTRSLITSQQGRIDAMPAGDENRPLAVQTLSAYQQRAAFIDRILMRLSELLRLLDLWQEELEWRRSETPIMERFRNLFAGGPEIVKKIWQYELFAAEDTIIIDGQPITERRPVTVSKVVRALLILTLGLWFGNTLARRFRALSVRRFKTSQNMADLIEKAIRAVIFISIVFFALTTVKIPLTVFAFLGGALAIGVGFGAQNLINNFISGIILLFERPIKVGDVVEVEGTRGRIVNIGGRCSQVKRFDGIDILVPNSSFLEKNVVNWTLSDAMIRLSISVGVAYGSPVREVTRLIGEAVDGHGKVLKMPEPVVLFEDFGDNALTFTVYFWTEISRGLDYRIVPSDLRFMIDKLFAEAGITIAFPQRDVHIDNISPVQVQIVERPQPEES